MNEIGEGIAARFKLHIRCENCVHDTARVLDIPVDDDAPTTIDELLESAFLARQRFVCIHCDNPIGLIASIKQVWDREPIHA